MPIADEIRERLSPSSAKKTSPSIKFDSASLCLSLAGLIMKGVILDHKQYTQQLSHIIQHDGDFSNLMYFPDTLPCGYPRETLLKSIVYVDIIRKATDSYIYLLMVLNQDGYNLIPFLTLCNRLTEDDCINGLSGKLSIKITMATITQPASPPTCSDVCI